MPGLALVLFFGLLFFNYYLSCGESCYGNPEGRSADIVHADSVAELDAIGIAPVLSANSDLEFRPRLAALLDAPAHQHSDSFCVERLERIRAEDAGLLLIHVVWQEAPSVV